MFRFPTAQVAHIENRVNKQVLLGWSIDVFRFSSEFRASFQLSKKQSLGIKLDGGPAFLLFLYVVCLCLLQGQQGFDFDNYLVKG